MFKSKLHKYIESLSKLNWKPLEHDNSKVVAYSTTWGAKNQTIVIYSNLSGNAYILKVNGQDIVTSVREYNALTKLFKEIQNKFLF